VNEKVEHFGRRVIRDHMPEQHRKFYQQLPFLFIGFSDADGWPWASILFDRQDKQQTQAFIKSPDERTLMLNTLPIEGDPLINRLNTGRPLHAGLLGIELVTRRRNRLSGVISLTENQTLDFKVKQSFGNCPQYIQARNLTCIQHKLPVSVVEFSQFDQAAIDLIRQADTFFVASD
jgi:uncharacterized protein